MTFDSFKQYQHVMENSGFITFIPKIKKEEIQCFFLKKASQADDMNSRENTNELELPWRPKNDKKMTSKKE